MREYFAKDSALNLTLLEYPFAEGGQAAALSAALKGKTPPNGAAGETLSAAANKPPNNAAGRTAKGRPEPAGESPAIPAESFQPPDGLSGITANLAVGRFSDLLIAQGGSTVLTEAPEMFGAEGMLIDRCQSREVFDKAVRMVEDFKHYFTSHGQVVYENPSPGNKKGGITTLEDKSCGCVQKGAPPRWRRANPLRRPTSAF